jgi:hypothetical protein
MPKNKTIEQGVRTLSAVIESGVIPAGVIRATRSLSNDPVYNLTCYLMADYGIVMDGMGEQDWKNEAKTILKILKK